MVLFFFISLVLGAAGAIIFARFGSTLGFLDRPEERSSHRIPTSKGGGIGILAAFICLSIYHEIPVVFWVPAMVVSIVGLYSDWREVSPRLRVITHFIAALVLIVGMSNLDPNSNWKFVLVPLWAIFIVGTANFYNFMDGINGIAGINAVMALGFIALYLYLNDLKLNFMFLSSSLSLACLGFLPFNMPKARVFMGDVGSLLIGFLYAGLVVVFSHDLLSFLCLSSFIFLFYADELTTMCVRLKDKENLLRPHRRHLYQILSNEYHLTHWKVSLGYGAAQLIIGLSILWIKSAGAVAVLSLIIVYFSGFSLFSFFVRRNLVERTSPGSL
jgi:Fuc2NAc and GlcNAc transferase